MRNQYAEGYTDQLVRNNEQTDIRRKSSDISSSALSVIVIGSFGLKRSGTGIKCKQCGLLVGPNEDSEHQLICGIKKIDLKVDRKTSGNKKFKWLTKWKQKSASSKRDDKSSQNSQKNGSISTQSERPGTATLDGPSVLDLNELTSLDMTLSVKALDFTASTVNDPIPRPETVTLLRPTPNLNTPNISNKHDKSSVSLKQESRSDRRLMSKTTKGRARDRKVNKGEEKASRSKTATYIEGKLPVPCKTCERSTLPERLHSHGTSEPFKNNLTAITLKKKADTLGSASSSRKKPNNSQHSHNRTKTQKSFSLLKSISSTNLKKTSKTKSIPSKKKFNNQANSGDSVLAAASDNHKSFKSSSSSSPKTVKKVQSKSEPPTRASSPVISISAQDNANNKERSRSPDVVALPKRPTKRGPATLLCYICGRDFGTKSLPLHEPRCLEKWRRENEQLPVNLRRSEPQKPDINYENASREEQNDAAWETFASQLSACPICNRTFFPDRLPIHMKACKGKEAVKNLSQPPSRAKKPKSKNVLRVPPTFASCYICGREYGTHSIALHEPQCLEKWRNENNKLPKERQRQEPIKPEIQLTDDGNVDVEATRNALWQSHLDQLVPCENCGRTFYPDRLASHQRGCKANTFKL